MKPNLLIIPSDRLIDYERKGYSEEERRRYFNPDAQFNVTILGFNEEGHDFDYAGFRVYPINGQLDRIESVVSEVRPDLVRGYNGNWGAKISADIGRRCSIPSFTSVHDMNPTESIDLVDRVICVSETVRDRCLIFVSEREKLEVIYDCVDMDIFRDLSGTEEVNTAIKMYPGDYRFLSVGRLVWEKNLENLMIAMKLVSSELGGVQHIHVGEFGDLKDKIMRKKEEIDFYNFNFIPNVNQELLAVFYSWADLFTLASVSEGFGLVYAEALACGTPVITSDISPINTIVRDRYNGLLVNPNSPEDIAEKIILAVSDRALYDSIKLNARKSVERFNIKILKEQEAELYKSMLK